MLHPLIYNLNQLVQNVINGYITFLPNVSWKDDDEKFRWFYIIIK
jgi:hypothetical protein